MFHVRCPPSRPGHGHQVEPGGAVRDATLHQKIPSHTFDLDPLARTGYLVGLGLLLQGSRAHFDENDGVAVLTYQVDLTGRTAVVAKEDSVTESPQISTGDLLTSCAEETPRTKPRP